MKRFYCKSSNEYLGTHSKRWSKLIKKLEWHIILCRHVEDWKVRRYLVKPGGRRYYLKGSQIPESLLSFVFRFSFYDTIYVMLSRRLWECTFTLYTGKLARIGKRQLNDILVNQFPAQPPHYLHHLQYNTVIALVSMFNRYILNSVFLKDFVN